MARSLLIVAHPTEQAKNLQAKLSRARWNVAMCTPEQECLTRAQETQQFTALVLCDEAAFPLEDLLDFIDLEETLETSCVVCVVKKGDVATAVRAMHRGVTTVLEAGQDTLLPETKTLLDTLQQYTIDTPIQEFRHRFTYGENSPIHGLLDILPQLARSESPILITGSSGTGKDLLAHTIHERSDRGLLSPVIVHCAAIPETLIESELFGHVAGSFTGATHDKQGQFELAHQNTLILDEIADIPLHVQVKLLRVLQDKQVYRVGSVEPIEANFRVIALTNKNIKELVGRGEFREDLYYRLNVLPIHIPDLKDRIMDITPLLQMFIAQKNKELHTNIEGVTAPALEILKYYEWPGNVREVENFVERLSVLKSSGYIEPQDLPEQIKPTPRKEPMGLDVPSEGIDITQTLQSVENQLITQALRKAAGNKARAARLLGLNRTTLVEKIKRKQLDTFLEKKTT